MRNASSRSHGLDTLRSVAILSVIFFHWRSYHGDNLPGALDSAAGLGWMGVDLFFVLSGYLIGSQLLKPVLRGEPVRVWSFYRNRAYRILPAYFLVLLLYYIVPVWPEDHTLAPLWQYLTFTHNLFVDYASKHAFSQVWSLCVEEHFYLLLPFIVLVLARRASARRTVALIAGLVLTGMAVRTFFLFHSLRPLADRGESFAVQYIERIYYPTYCRLDGLLAGVSLALVKAFRPAWWSAIARRGHVMLVAGLLLVAVCCWMFQDRFASTSGSAAASAVIGFPLLALGLACLVASALSTNGWLRFRIPGAQLCATLAYCLYLTQKELFHLTDIWFPKLAEAGWLAWLAGYMSICFSVAGMLHVCVERPFLLRRDRRRFRERAQNDIKVQSIVPLISEPAGEDQNA